MKLTSIFACLAAGFFSVTSLASQQCHQFIINIDKQLDKCSNNKLCLDAAFYQALDTKKHGTKYIECKPIFDAEVSYRSAQLPIPPLESMEQPAQQFAGNCNNAFYFLGYATKSCKTSKCVDQQYNNTIKIPVFQHCAGALITVRDARKATLPAKSYQYYSHDQYKYPVKSAQK